MRKFALFLLSCLLYTYLLAITVEPSSAQEGGISPTVATDSPTRTSGSTPTPNVVVQVATPGSDGAIKHEVSAGETLITIADAYGVSLNELLELNGMNTDSVIFPGEELVIRAGFTATPTSSPTRTATKPIVPTSTRRPTRTPLPQTEGGTGSGVAEQTQLNLTPAVTPDESAPDRVGNVLLAVIAVLGVGGVVLIVVGSVLRRGS
jgi:LysM repeat protein